MDLEAPSLPVRTGGGLGFYPNVGRVRMSTYLEGANHVKDHQRGEPVLGETFADKFPEVSAAFSGSVQEGSDFWKVPPASITLFVEGGRLKFVINPSGFGQVCFGTVQDARTGLEGVDEAIRQGHCEWKHRSGQKRS